MIPAPTPRGLVAWLICCHCVPHHFPPVRPWTAHADLWALPDESTRLMRFTRRDDRRFYSAFFLGCLRGPPQVYQDLAIWQRWRPAVCSSPSKATESFISKEIWLELSEIYEIRTLENFAPPPDLHKFCSEHVFYGVERCMPITVLTADGSPSGDKLYSEGSDFSENRLFVEEKD